MTVLMIIISGFQKVFKTPVIELLPFEFVAEDRIPVNYPLIAPVNLNSLAAQASPCSDNNAIICLEHLQDNHGEVR